MPPPRLLERKNRLPSERDILGERHGRVVVLLELVHPDLSCASGVPGEDVSGAARKSVRVLFPENVADSAARDDLQAAAALPHPERHFWKFPDSGFKTSNLT